MTAEEFRRLLLALPEAIETAHRARLAPAFDG
jgi:hypothetical protein